MNHVHNKYVISFKRFADALLEGYLNTDGMIDITKALSQKANQLVMTAIYTANVDIIKLKRELYDLEQEYLNIILSRHNQNLL
jgi:hypothetical protein